MRQLFGFKKMPESFLKQLILDDFVYTVYLRAVEIFPTPQIIRMKEDFTTAVRLIVHHVAWSIGQHSNKAKHLFSKCMDPDVKDPHHLAGSMDAKFFLSDPDLDPAPKQAHRKKRKLKIN